MLMFCLVTYIVAAVLSFALIWAALVLAKQDDARRGYDLLKDYSSPVEPLSKLKGTK